MCKYGVFVLITQLMSQIDLNLENSVLDNSVVNGLEWSCLLREAFQHFEHRLIPLSPMALHEKPPKPLDKQITSNCCFISPKYYNNRNYLSSPHQSKWDGWTKEGSFSPSGPCTKEFHPWSAGQVPRFWSTIGQEQETLERLWPAPGSLFRDSNYRDDLGCSLGSDWCVLRSLLPSLPKSVHGFLHHNQFLHCSGGAAVNHQGWRELLVEAYALLHREAGLHARVLRM